MIHYWIRARHTLVFGTVIPVAIGMILGIQGWRWHREAAAFVEHSRAVVGRIIRFQNANGDLQAEVEHLDEEGVPYRGTYKIPSSDETTLRASGTVNMVYDSRNPRSAQVGTIVGASNEALLAYATLAACLCSIFYGLSRLLHQWRKAAGIRGLFAHGALVRTQVREVTIPKGSATGRFTYAFRGPNGRWYEGKSPEMTIAELVEWPVGRPVIAAFDTAAPNTTEPDVFGVLGELKRPIPS